MTNNPRIYLWIALALMVWLNYDAWQRDYGPTPSVITNTTQPANGKPATATSSANDLANQIPEAPKESAPATAAPAAAGATGSTTGESTDSVPGSAVSGSTAPGAASAPVVHVRTDVLDVDISTVGGTIQRADLLKYPKVKGETTPVRLENQDDPQSTYVLQSGLTGAPPTPSHVTTLQSAKSDYQLGADNELRVPLTWTGDNGVQVTKTF